MNTKDGGPAFPFVQPLHIGTLRVHDQWDIVQGMSLRDYFIAHAPVTFQDAVSVFQTATLSMDRDRAMIMAVLALMRVEYADAMLAKRSKNSPKSQSL